MEAFFKLHIIPPPHSLDWSTPRSLLRDTLFNHLIQDPAPIGHFYIEFKSNSENRWGVKHVLTGMSRAHRNRSTVKVIWDQVGLGTFFYDFPGTLDHAKDSLKKLAWARKRNRLKTLCVPLAPGAAEVLFDELNAWIRHGSFRHYGGGHQVLKGEGSGCAEFGSHFLNLALGVQATPRPWVRSVLAPIELVGGAKFGKRVSMLRVFLEGRAWANHESSGVRYSTPDMELASRWLESKSPGAVEYWIGAQDLGESPEILKRISFSDQYPEESEETVSKFWKHVSLA